MLADDTLAMWIDGQLIVNYATGPNSTCQTNEPNCRVIDQIAISNLLLTAGTNTITVIDDQTNDSAAGIDFQGNLTAGHWISWHGNRVVSKKQAVWTDPAPVASLYLLFLGIKGQGRNFRFP